VTTEVPVWAPMQMTTRGAAHHAGVSLETVRQAVRDGLLPVHKHKGKANGNNYFRRDEVEVWITSQFPEADPT